MPNIFKKNKLYSPQGYLQKSNSGQLFKKKKANIGENILGILSAVQCILIYLNKLLLKNSAHICRKNWGKNHESYSGIMKCKLIRYRCNVFVLPSNHKI